LHPTTNNAATEVIHAGRSGIRRFIASYLAQRF
jgi:hypothetical protein